MTRGFFITGTDTDVGKTWVTLGVLQALAAAGCRTAAFKPVASGGIDTEVAPGIPGSSPGQALPPATLAHPCASQGLRNGDAVLLQRAATLALTYEEVNPYLFRPPIAPHLAAQDAGVRIELARIKAQFDRLAARADVVIVEGAGGWLVPLNERETIADMVKCLGLPVILVVGMRLGCLNHALLSAQSIAQHGVPLAGWVANAIQPQFPELERNVAALCERLAAPLLGKVPYLAQRDGKQIAAALDVKSILGALGGD